MTAAYCFTCFSRYFPNFMAAEQLLLLLLSDQPVLGLASSAGGAI